MKTTTTTAHTPGPWIADPCSHADGSTTIRVADGSECGDTDCQPIAQVWNSRDDRLIATAPELLMVLTHCYLDLVGVMPEYEPSGDRLHPGWLSIEEARAAIIKAGGEA
jgi:hypothetical protein